VRLFGTALLTAAAVVGTERLVRRDRAPYLVGAAAAVVVVSVLVGLLLGASLPPPVAPDLDLQGGRVPVLAGHPLVLGAQLLTAALYAVAAVGFTRQASRGEDELVRWLGPACAVAAVARVAYLLFPSLYSQYVCLGDVLRLAFYVLLLVGAAREVRSYWARVAVLEDRRRMARDLHDGLAQELSYIWSQTTQLADGVPDADAVKRINGAAVRALDEARGAIVALTRTSPGAFHDVLHATAEGLASRYDAKVVLEIDETVSLSPAEGDAVLRIVAEAFRNAVLHGGASCVTVEMAGPPLRLCVRDDGAGFDPALSKNSSGFGLTSMRERAEGLGASFDLESRAGKGTVVTVVWS
jgi:signal transduction histidine kinase